MSAATNQPTQREPQYLNLVFRQVPGVVWATDRNLRFTYVHGRLMLPSVESDQHLVGTTVYEFVGSYDPADPPIARHLAALTGKRQSFQHLFSGRWFDVMIEPLRDVEGTVIGCVGAAIDVTERREEHERLASSEARLAEAQRVAHVGSFEWDGQNDQMIWSEELLRIYGVTDAESPKTCDAFLAMVHDDDRRRVRAAIHDAFREQKAFAFDHRIVKPDGEVRMLHSAGDVITGDGPVKVVGSCWDITEQHETMEQLRQTVSVLEATLASTADGILVVNREGTVSTYNNRFLTLWRVPPALAAEGDDAALLSYVADQLEDPKAFLDRVQELYAAPDDAFDIVRFKDGRVFERYSMPQVVGGEAVGRVWSFRDVTRREHLLLRQTFLSDASRLLASLDIEKALREVARLAVRYLGERCAVDLIRDGQSERLIVAGRGNNQDSLPELPPGLAGGHPTIYTAASRSHMAVPFVCRNTVVGALTLVAPPHREYTRDDLELLIDLGRRIALSIDNARLYEGARDALNARDEFMSVAAHEIRGPLTSIHLAAQSLLKGTLPPRMVQTALDVIQREDRRLARFVNELLDFSRIRGGRLQFELQELDLGTVVRDVVSQLSPEMNRAGSTVTVTTEGNLLGRWDRFRLEQVVTNLLSNASKYGDGKPIDVTVAEIDGRVRIRVVDRGIGIEPSMQSRIFDPFQRAVAARHYGGLGLGLHISKTIVEGFGGTIGVESRPGEGSTFTVDLPASRES